MLDNALTVEVIVLAIILAIIFFIELFQTSFDNLSYNALKNQVEDEEIEDNKKVNRLLKLIKNPLRYLYTNKLVRILCWTAIGYVGIGAVYYELYHRSYIHPIWIILAGLLGLFILIAIVVYFPRKLALQHSYGIAIKFAGIQNALCVLLAPFREFILLITNLFLKIFRQKTDIQSKTFYEEDVISMLEEGEKSGAIKEEGKKMINSIFAFDDKLAHEIMTPRTDVFMIDVNAPYKDYKDKLMELVYSRIPVYENEPDNIIGILNVKDYLIQTTKKGFDNVKIKKILRDPFFAPETKNIDSLFKELQKEKQQLAILIDEYGGFSGIVTMEDIVEEIVGDIDDEYDQEELPIKKIGDNEYLIEGNTELSNLNDELGLNLQSDSSETIGGFIIDLIGELPEEGKTTKAVYENYELLVLKVEDRRISKVKLTILDEAKSEESQNTEEK